MCIESLLSFHPYIDLRLIFLTEIFGVGPLAPSGAKGSKKIKNIAIKKVYTYYCVYDELQSQFWSEIDFLNWQRKHHSLRLHPPKKPSL